MLTITCPYCGEEIEVSEDLDDYDWNSGVSLDGRADINCPECRKELQLEAEGYIDCVTCITENDEPTEEELYLAHIDDLVDLHRDREMGFE